MTPAILNTCRVPDLIIADYMYGSTDIEFWNLTYCEALVYDALGWECSVTMNLDI